MYSVSRLIIPVYHILNSKEFQEKNTNKVKKISQSIDKRKVKWYNSYCYKKKLSTSHLYLREKVRKY